MSAIAADTPDLAFGTIDPAQHSAAKVAGLLYLLLMATAFLADGDGGRAMGGFGSSERLVRIDAAANVIAVAGGVMLMWALYVVLRPIDRNVALLAVSWQLVNCSVHAVITLSDFAALALLDGTGALHAFDAQQLDALVLTFEGVHGAGYRLGLVFYGLASAAFAYLWFRSRYIPRGFAVLGIVSNLVFAIGFVAAIVFPSLPNVVIAVAGPPGFIFEVGLALWLLVKGIRVPVQSQ